MNLTLVLSIIAILLSVLSISVFAWLYFIFKDLIKISKNKDFSNNTTEIQNIKTEIDSINFDIKSHIQKVGLIKFNPFGEIGGDHSFSLALLDGKKNGIIITSLHTRERTRLYVKEVSGGSSIVELSKEESKALKKSIG